MTMKIGNGVFYHGDCFEVMRSLPDGCVDMVLCDLPYGTTQNKWDSVLPLDQLWREYWRLCRGAVVLTAAQPFTSALVMSQIGRFKYDWVWRKNKASGQLNAKRRPMLQHESVLVFCSSAPPYNPQMIDGCKPGNYARQKQQSKNYGATKGVEYGGSTSRYPKTVLDFSVVNNDSPERAHPTQKPAALFEYLIRTYTDEGMVVLDNTAGSGTTAIAAENANRRWICIERDDAYYAKAVERVRNHVGLFA